MKKIKFLHCADIHLDAPFTSLGTEGDKSRIRRQDLLETFQKMIDTAKEEKVDMIFISGDLYEHDYVKKSTIHFINDQFSRIPEIKVFIVPGNHDPMIPNSYYRSFQWCENVWILDDERPYMRLEELQTCIYGLGFKNFHGDGFQSDRFERVSNQWFNILLVHGTVDMEFGKGLYNPIESVELERLEMDYVALGHFHQRTDGMGRSGKLYNPGSLEPLGFDELGDHGAYIGEIVENEDGGRERDIRFAKLNKRSYKVVEVNVSGCNTGQQVVTRVKSAVENQWGQHDLYHVTLKGRVEPGFKIDSSEVRQALKDTLFFIKIKNEAVEDYDFEGISAEPGLRGLFVRKMLELIRKAPHENERKQLTRSLYYGMEALEKGKVEIQENDV